MCFMRGDFAGWTDERTTGLRELDRVTIVTMISLVVMVAIVTIVLCMYS